MENKFLTRVACVGFHLRFEPSRHFTYEIHAKWSTGQSVILYRRYSQFFNLQCKLLDTFPLEAGSSDPSKRTLPFLPGKRIAGKFSEKIAEKRRAKFDVYLQKLIELPNIGCCSLVLQFFESTESDVVSLLAKKSSSLNRNSVKTAQDITNPIAFPQFLVVRDYTKTQKGELSVTAGTTVFIAEKKHTGWWLAQTQDGDEHGWVPASYLDPLYNDIDPEEDELAILPVEPLRFITTSDYRAAEEDELTVKRGCVVEVLAKSLDGWWTCRYGGKEGLFPAAYLQKANSLKAKKLLQLSRQTSDAAQTSLASAGNRTTHNKELSHYAPPRLGSKGPKPSRPPPPPPIVQKDCIYAALADFPSSMSDGVDLKEGVQVKVISKDDSGWWYVETGGIKGWAPSTYIQRVENSLLPATSAVNGKPKPARPCRPPSTKSSPQSQPKTVHNPGLQRPSTQPKPQEGTTDHSMVSKHRVVDNNNLVEIGASKALGKERLGILSAKPNVAKKPVISDIGAKATQTKCEREDKPPAQESVAELRRKFAAKFSS